MEDKGVMDEIETAASSSLREEGKTGMSRHIKEMVSACSISEVNLKTLAEEPKFGAGDDLSGKVELVLADPPYNVRIYVNDDHSEHNLFELIDMKQIARVLREIIRPGAHWHVFCPALQAALWYNALAFEKREKQGSSLEDSRESGTESE